VKLASHGRTAIIRTPNETHDRLYEFIFLRKNVLH